jgi:hypothetical protein
MKTHLPKEPRPLPVDRRVEIQREFTPIWISKFKLYLAALESEPEEEDPKMRKIQIAGIKKIKAELETLKKKLAQCMQI